MMNKLAFIYAYVEPQAAYELYQRHFGDEESLEKTSMDKRAAWYNDVWEGIKNSYQNSPNLWHGLAGAGLGAGAGYMMGGGKGALMGAGIGGLGGYAAQPLYNMGANAWNNFAQGKDWNQGGGWNMKNWGDKTPNWGIGNPFNFNAPGK